MIFDHQQKLIEIKSDLMDFHINSNNELDDLNEFVLLISKLLERHFLITNCIFFKWTDDLFKPVNHSDRNMNLYNISSIALESYFKQQSLIPIPPALKKEKGLEQMTHMLLLKIEDQDPSGVFVFKESLPCPFFDNLEFMEKIVLLLSEVVQTKMKNINMRQNEIQYRKLYDIANLFHSTMDVDTILQNVLAIIKDNFPNLKIELILSNNQDQKTKVNIKQFDYLSERATTIEAFLSGEMTAEHIPEFNCYLLNAPIKGQQATYGILQVTVQSDYTITVSQREFIQVLAQASGNALENAKLYHQSSRLISDLQLINETSHRLNMRLDIDEMLLFLQKQLMKSFHPMELCFIFKEDEQFEMTSACTGLFKTAQGDMYIQHVEKHFSHSQDPLFIADFRRIIEDEHIEFRSIMAIPMIVEERINGFSIVMHSEPYFFSFDSFKLMQSLIHHSSLAIANSKLRHQLQEMVDKDHLTGLYARSYLDHFVEKSLHEDDAGMFLLIDIDNFKHINDTFGHQMGDTILKQIGMQLQRIVSKQGICARWGGEEMSVYIPNVSDKEAFMVAKTLVDSIPKVTEPSVTISAGLITWDKEERPEFQALFLHADTALYNAKNNGKNQVCIFHHSMQLQH
ncbi:sensor domain-containing diguanylate cyclase [Lysinibacillus louembei]|uniref:Sensor domain-containing diguanylate cyclase n=1 Tax=Lysinibacillus louembei TaxID=1470088 RepID=A0ABZ0RTK8_9BACI|nr:sensor domain-containing diguanylate cyclase [Lysinibacillus louembei]WPK10612.1 sensor domain-containing diguanylate cyclase [Lysinibacillus louembei]